ncbi:hypothetical protein GLOIN_2v1483954 [Rhizophagus irregularis DAOM 181602=DAOM 197198]|uniref:Bromo domain-containing protein n=1 Tax=Rhizophagus irregularis (strain DAOM 181602 / DAOM 197198 / MUCL 43194) TaxID=747089 RepID=A0A2P4PG71_RHIID|nr:hypothetical protein GLOIN_2v1483954 [Rhizophagus irregularis DAOM 181602=DAOM 197198]POG64394.1 hypothetical protein GLOIN_2v1483954 [Rhizophagus irregularis DAOM 181602=DAOM 197198]|eukprot:XP_025171260.1 hypothetical protein GLOIN_2v1483954 [Rhizophagus irregularis DAOM 181602=DAOM 197198]
MTQKNINISISEGYSGQDDNWNNLDNLWAGCFLCEGKDFPDLKDKIATERLCYAKILQIFWKGIIKEYKKKKKSSICSCISFRKFKDDYCKITKKNASHSENVIETPTNDHSISVKDDYYKITKKNNIIDFCCDILQELDGKYNIHPFYKYDEKETAIKNPIDLFTINSKLENNQYTKPVTKQIRILEQNKDKLVYNQVVNNAFLIASAYENLVAVNLIKNQKDKFNTNVLEKLDKIIEKEDEKVLLGRSYAYWSKEYKETKQTTIGEILDSGVNQLKSYMNIISKVKQVIILVQEYLTNGLK